MKILCFNKLLTAKVQKTNQFIKYRSINLFVNTDNYSRSPQNAWRAAYATDIYE